MSFFDLILKVKFKYVISFICIITFYIFAFEKRYFQINSDWKLLCHENSISLCEFGLKVTNINNSGTKNLAVFSGSTKELHVIDIFNSFKYNPAVLSSPKLFLFKEHLNQFILFDLTYKNDDLLFVGLDSKNKLKLFNNWEMIFERSLVNENIIKKHERIVFHTLDLISRENLILMSGLTITGNDVNTTIIVCLNASDGSVRWNVSIKDDKFISSKNENQNTLKFRSEVFTHWKLKLMQHHKELNHLKQKTNHVDLMNNYPIYFSGKNEVFLLKSEKKLKGFYKNKLDKNTNEFNYNSIALLHKYGLSLLDIHTGSLLATEKIELNPHSTYALWPSNDYQENENIFEIRFLSKLDHYSKDHMDINHIQDDSTMGAESMQHKIHCNLVFRKINPDSSIYETNNFFVGHLCDPVSYMDYPRFGDKSWLEDPTKSVSPLVTNNHAAPSGLWGRLYHLIGRKLIDTNSKDVICISSDGLMTSFSSHGHQNWRTNAQIGWLHISRMVKMVGMSTVDSSTKQIYDHYFKPSLTELKMSYLNQTIRGVLSLGFDSISVVDLSDGYLLASHSLPCTPVDKPNVIRVHYQGMLSMSGDIVFIVKCENMVIGFSITHYIPWVYFGTLCLLMLITVLFLMWSLDPKNSYFGEFWA